MDESDENEIDQIDFERWQAKVDLAHLAKLQDWLIPRLGSKDLVAWREHIYAMEMILALKVEESIKHG